MTVVALVLALLLPTPSPSPEASITDPCGGSKELLNKLNPSPCVFVTGEAMVSGGYANIATNGHLTISGPLQPGIVLPISGTANVYPNLLVAAGVSHNAQLQFTLPSSIQLELPRFGRANATSDTSVDYKQLVYVSPKQSTMAGADLGYRAPTGTSSSPAYRVELLFSQSLSDSFSAGAYWTFENVAITSNDGVTQHAWSVPIGVYLGWSPPHGGFAFSPLVTHSFSPNRTVLVAEVDQLIDRHFLVDVEYGGLGVSAAGTGGLGTTFTFSGNANPRAFAIALYFLIGESSLSP